MSKLSKSLLLVGLIGVVSLMLTAPVSAQSEVPAHQPSLFLGNGYYPPLIYLERGRPTGLVADLALAVLDKGGIDGQFQAKEWKQAQADVSAGTADALVLINKNSDRENYLDFSTPLITSEFVFFRKSARVDIQDTDTLQHKKVGVERGGYTTSIMRKFPAIQVYELNDIREGFELLERGIIDAVITERWTGMYVLTQMDIQDIGLIDKPIETSTSHIAVRKGNKTLLDKINRGLALIEHDGTRQAIFERWSGKQIVHVTQDKISYYRLTQLLAGAVIVLLSLLFFYSKRLAHLKKEGIERQKQQLEQRIEVQTKKSGKDIYQLSHVDGLTGLPNRFTFMDQLESALALTSQSAMPASLIVVSSNKFKFVNETLGYDYENLLLMEVAYRLKQCIGDLGFVARLGADEFAVITHNFRTSDAPLEATRIAEKIRVCLAAPYQLNESAHYISPAIGIALFMNQELPAEDLVKRAEIAMLQAKEGRHAIFFFNPLVQESMEKRAQIESDLRQAIEKQQFELYYQVQVDTQRRPIGAEALIRWLHPERGIISPGEFIPIAETSDMIIEIGRWVLDKGCQQLEKWQEKPITRGLTLAINISAQHFEEPGFVEEVKAAMQKYRVDPATLKLELTESLAMQDMEYAVQKMLELKRVLNVKLALDDFGTGYSSMSYLTRMPLDQIKIDRSFVQHVTSNPRDAIMVRSIIDLSKNFGFEVIAEGVESEAHVKFLQLCGCLSYQGYLFGKPVPIGEFEACLANSSHHPNAYKM